MGIAAISDTAPRDALAVGIDLRSGPRYPTGIATMDGEHRCRLIAVVRTDDDILNAVDHAHARVVAIDAPLALPEGRDCADPGCACATAGIMREVDRIAAREGFRPFPSLLPSMVKLTLRGIALREALQARGHAVLEVYPGMTQDVLGIPRKGAGLDELRRGLRRHGVRGLPRSRRLSHDELDAVTCALTGQLYLQGLTEVMGPGVPVPLVLPDRALDWRLVAVREEPGRRNVASGYNRGHAAEPASRAHPVGSRLVTRVFVTRELPGGAGDGSPVARLREVLGAENVDVWPDFDPPSRNAFLDRTEGCDGVLCMINDRIDAAFLDARPTVRAVAQLAVGYDNIDVPACTQRGVAVTNTPDVLSDATADMAWALLMAAARRLPAGRDAIEQGRWGQWNPTWMLSSEVTGRTLGIVGPGRIGAAAARRASGFDMTVLYSGHSEKPGFPGSFVPLDELLARSDFVSVHVPLTDETRSMCDASFFRRMQRHAIFVNTSRGAVVDQRALISALEDGTIAAAGLDVMTPEPLPPDDPLVHAPNIVLSPHVGSATLETRTKMAHLAVDGLLAGIRGERVRHLLNPEALNAASRR